MLLPIVGRTFLPKFSLTSGVYPDGNYLTPRDVWVLHLDEHADVDTDAIEKLFPDHIIVHGQTVYIPFSKEEKEKAKEEYIDQYLSRFYDQLLNLSMITIEPGLEDVFEESIESDIFAGDDRIKGYRYPNGKYVFKD